MIREYLSLVLSLIALLLLVNTNSLSDIYAQVNNTPLQSNISQNSPNSTMGQEINLSKIVTEVKNPQTGETEALSIKDPQTRETEFIESSEIELNNSNDSLLAGEVAGNIETLEGIELGDLELDDLSIAKTLQERELNLFKSCIIDPNSHGFSSFATYEIGGKASMSNPEIRNYTVSKDMYVGLNSRGDKVTGDIRSGDYNPNIPNFNPMIEINRIVTNCYSEKDFRSNSIPLLKTIPLKSHSLNPPTNSCPEGFHIIYNIYGTINNLKNTITIDNPSSMSFSLRMSSDFVNGNLESRIQVDDLRSPFKINNINIICTTEN